MGARSLTPVRRYLLPACLAFPLGATAVDPPVEPLVAAARRVQEADLEAWHRFRFRREVLREKLDGEGNVTSREKLEFRITPTPEGFDERLLAIDGREPRASQVREHRRKARFTERYREALEGGEDPDDLSLFRLLYLGRQRYAGREVLDGVACHRIEFSPSEEPAGNGGAAARIGRAMEGTVWIAVDGLHLHRARARLREPVSLVMGLAHLRDLRIELDTVAVEEDVRLPGRIVVNTAAGVLGFSVRKRNTFTYTAYEPVAATELTTGGGAGTRDPPRTPSGPRSGGWPAPPGGRP